MQENLHRGTGRRLADRFREHLRDAEQNNTDASKPIARHFNLPNHSHHYMTICGLSLHHGNLHAMQENLHRGTGRRLADRFREHLRDAEQNNTDASKPIARHFNLPNHSHHYMTICGLSLHHGNTGSRKNLKQKFIFQLGTLSPHGINERLSFH